MKKSIFLIFAAILCATSAWAGPSFKGGYVYFHNKGGWSKSSKQLCIGKSNYTETRSMTVVNNTQLWYNSLPTSGWTDATYMAVINNSSDWGSGSWGPSNLTNATYYTKKVDLGNWGFNSGAYQMLTPASGSNNATLSLDWVGSSISAMNKTITIKAKVSTDKGATYAEKTSPGTLTASSFEFTNYKTCTTTTSLSSGKITCGYTANTTLTAQTDVAGYSFAGWYNASGTKQTADATLNINPTEDVTYYAYYIQEETHNVTVYYKNGSEEIGTQSTIGVGVYTPSEVLAKDIPGYQFTSWTWGDGIATTDAATANPIHITTNSTGDYTLTALYKPETIYFVNTDEWETVNVYAWAGSGASEIKNAEWPGEKLLSPVDNIGGYDVYAFTSGAGYEKLIFNNGSGTQTDDLTWTADKYYVYYGQTSKDPDDWYTKDAVESALPDWLATNVYLAGSMTNWGTNKIEFRKSAKSDYAAYLTVDLTASTDYTLKIVRGSEWTSYNDAEIKDNIDYLQFSQSVNDNCKMKTKDAGTYVFVWYINDSKLSVWYPSEYTVVGTDVLLGENWGDGLDNLDNKMVKQGDNSYKLVKEDVVLPANTYEWQIARNGDWWSSNKKVNPDDNNKLQIVTAGKYNITFTLAADLQSATATAEFIEAVDEVAKCYVTGNTTLTGHDWGVHDELEMDYDKTTETYTYTLQSLTTEKDYELKIVCGGTWFDYSALTSPISTGVVKGNNNAIAFQMAADGDVVVTYNATTGIQLSGNFKEPETNYYVVGDFNSWVSDNNSKMTTTDKVIYTKTLTLDAGEYFFKVNVGSWASQWGWANVSGTYSEVKDAEDDNKIKLVLTGQKTFTIKFIPSKHTITFENLTLLQIDCFLMGVGEDWENGIKMTQNPKNVDEYMLLCQPIAADEDIKIKVGAEWCGEVDNKDFEGYVKNLDNGNIVLKAGTYDFYYKAKENKVYIAYPSVGDNDNSKTLSLLNGKTATVKVNRTFEAGKLYTIALPFAINDVKTVFGASTVVYEFSNLEKKDNEFILYFNDAITSIEAGKPYLIKPSGAHLVDGFTYKNAVINSQPTSISQTIDGTTITMEPVLSATAGAMTNGKYWLASDNVLYKNNTSLKSLRAVFNIQSNKANVRARVAFNENVETGVEDIITTETPVKVIKNGQLIIIREGVKYNVQGQKL